MIFQHKILEGGVIHPQVSANDMWAKITHEIRKIAKETLAKSRGFGLGRKESGWWKESI